MARKKKQAAGASSGWLTTYSDMVTLMLCFFVMVYNPSDVDITILQSMAASISGDPTGGGQSVSIGRLADLGNTINAMPSLEKGKKLGTALKKAVSLFAPEIKTNKIAVTSDERGLVISLAADAFFHRDSSDLDIEETRESLLHIARFLSDKELEGRRFRVEGHTSTSEVAASKEIDDWQLSSQRAINVLHYLTDFGAEESRFSVASYADTRPKASNDTAEGRAYNRRVDIIILDEGHF